MALIIRVGEHEIHRYHNTTPEALLVCIAGMRTARWEYVQRVTLTIDGSQRFTYSDLEHIDTTTAADNYIKELQHGKETGKTAADDTRPPARRARKRT